MSFDKLFQRLNDGRLASSCEVRLVHTGSAAGGSENRPSAARLFEFQAEQCAQRSEGIVSFEMGVGQRKILFGPGKTAAAEPGAVGRLHVCPSVAACLG